MFPKIPHRNVPGILALALAITAALAIALSLRDAPPRAQAAPGAQAIPANDNVAGASNVYVDAQTPQQTVTSDTTAATLEPDEARPCGNIGATVWYYFVTGQNMTLTIDTAGSSFDTALAVWELGPDIVPSPPGGGVLVACDDNGLGAQSKLTVHAAPGHIYWIQAGGANSRTGSLSLGVACAPACPAVNDSFGNFINGQIPFQDSTSTLGATDEPDEPRPCAGIGKTLWYVLFVTGNTVITINTDGSDFDTAVAAYVMPLQGLSSLADLQAIGCASGLAGQAAKLNLAASPGMTYYLQVGGVQGASGRLQISVDCAPAPCPPQNDSSGSPAYVLVPSSLPSDAAVDTRGASNDGGEPLDCGGMGRTVWYIVQAQAPATVVFDAAGSDFATAIAVYDGGFSSPPGALHRLACGTSPAGGQARLQFDIARSQTLFVQVGGMNGASGQLRLHADCLPVCPPLNDYVDGALFMYASPQFDDARNTRAATLEPGEQQPCGNVGKTVWYSLSPGSQFHFSTEGSSFPTVIALQAWTSASPPGALTPAQCSTTGAMDFTPQPGIGYMLQVGGVDGSGGDLQVHVTCLAECPILPIGGQGGGGDVVSPSAGVITPPNTGSGGYLPESRRR